RAGGEGVLLAGRCVLRARRAAGLGLCAGPGLCAVDGQHLCRDQSSGRYPLRHRRSASDGRMSSFAAASTLRHAAWVLRGNPLAAVAAAGALLLALVAIFGPSLVPYDPVASDVPQALLPPSASHWAGTDQLGRDVFSRLVVATRLDLAIAVTAVSISFVIGAVIGSLCGYAGGKLDRAVGRFVDVLMAFPLFVLAMAMVAALG